jgi:predicted phage-related endonuclease
VDDADNVLAHWPAVSRTTVSTKRLRAEYPAIYEQLVEHASARRFTLA